MSSERLRTVTRSHPRSSRHLVLIRGGLDARPPVEDGGPDWQSFCNTIGWGGSTEPDGDFESRLTAKLIDQLAARPPVVAVCEAKPGSTEPETARPSWRYRTFGVLGAAAAALVMLTAGGLSWSSRGAQVSVHEHASRTVLDATTARTIDDGAPIDAAPIDTGPLDTAPIDIGPTAHDARDSFDKRGHEDRSPKTAPEPRHRATDHPGALVASTRNRGGVARRWRAGLAALVAHEPAREVEVASERMEPDFDEPSSHAVAPASFTLAPRAESASTAVAVETTGGASQPSARSWALAPEGERFVGASIAPTPTANTAPGGIGVVAQLDVGRALSSL